MAIAQVVWVPWVSCDNTVACVWNDVATMVAKCKGFVPETYSSIHDKARGMKNTQRRKSCSMPGCWSPYIALLKICATPVLKNIEPLTSSLFLGVFVDCWMPQIWPLASMNAGNSSPWMG